MNIAEDFVGYMENNNIGVFGSDIFIGGVPLEAPANSWWIIARGGTGEKNTTGEMIKTYLIDVYYRSADTKDLYDKMQSFQDEINSKNCIELDNYSVISAEATGFGSDQDLDSEDRTVGLVQVAITIYSEL